MKQIILGTAGHIDHGKTSLIKAATGINTDRLKEEKLRGITIELGFAFIDLPGGRHIGIVDVPGHEKFVKNMVAGATGIDIVAMVIAADEGVMPQTKEHMEICSLLGIRHGFIVITKIDMVDEEWLELITEDIKDFVRSTFLENAPIIKVSSTTGEGIPEFIEVLDKLSSRLPDRPSSNLFRLPVDRVFTMKGFGTVITGTLISGEVEVGENVMLYPSLITSKVRGIQVHNNSLNKAGAGMRTAVNFQGLEKTSVNRGDILSNSDVLIPSYMVDVSFFYLKGNKKPIKNRARIRFHAGTSEILGIIILLEKDELMPGESAIAQIRLDVPVTLVKNDRFVIRSYSPVRTIGGGQILNPVPKKHKRFKPNVIKGLKSIIDGLPENIISYYVNESGYGGVGFNELKIMTSLPNKKLQSTLQDLMSKRIIILADRENGLYIHQNIFEKLKKEASECLGRYHKDHPLKAGMFKEELKSKLPGSLNSKFFNNLIMYMIKEGLIVQEENTVRLSSHRISLGSDQMDIRKKILEIYTKFGLTPPYFKELVISENFQLPRAKDVLTLLLEEGHLVKVKEDFYFHAQAIDNLKKRLVDFLVNQGEITTPQFKDMTGISRKYLIPLIEYFDAQNVTIRIGDIRKLRTQSKSPGTG